MPLPKWKFNVSKKPGKLILYTATLAISAGLVGACVEGPQRPFSPEPPKTGKPAAGEAPSYAQIQPIIEKHCVSCHMGLHKNLSQYEELKKRADSGVLTLRVFTEKSMPFKPSAQADAMTDEERSLIAKWAEAGAPMEGSQSTCSPTEPTTPDPMPVPAPVLTELDHLINCTTCHGIRGQRVDGMVGVPNLAGMNKAYILKQLKAYKAIPPTRSNPLMEGVLQSVPEKDLEFLANYFNLYPAIVEDREIPASEVDQNKFTNGKVAAAMCTGCHLDQGDSPLGAPHLRGQAADYIANQLAAFKAGTRQEPMMNGLAAGLDDETIAALAYYYSLEPYYKTEAVPAAAQANDQARADNPAETVPATKESATSTKVPTQ